jgi:hypothetical protein
MKTVRATQSGSPQTNDSHAVLRAEGVATPGPFHLDKTAAFIHRRPATAISTANS